MTVRLENTENFEAQDSGVPAPGQRVKVRNRPWVVTDVTRSATVSDDPARAAEASATHLVELSSLEGDARDERLRVVWELEPGTSVRDEDELPSPAAGFDEPGRLDAFLDAVRWGAIASADKTALQAPFRSGLEIQDYQLDPVVRALSMPYRLAEPWLTHLRRRQAESLAPRSCLPDRAAGSTEEWGSQCEPQRPTTGA
ncbi:hypothetical protein ABTX60_36095 [Streptomyces sp. NPDC126510]|uniref:hypothetical protein n=1 Tax=Streptomyces sp. NPDC126510 TaxID=3155317 RepID=UPI00331B49C7